MASLQILASVLLCLIVATIVAQLPPPDDDFARVIVVGDLLAGTYTDGTTVISEGHISAETATFTGDLMAGDSTFGTITAADTWLQDVNSDTALFQNLWAESLLSFSRADFQQDLWIEGDLTSGLTAFGPTTVQNLTVTEDAVVEGIIFAKKNIQVTSDVNVAGNSRFFGDFIANQSVIIEQDLTVKEMSTSENLFVANLTDTEDLIVTGMSNIGELVVDDDTMVQGNFSAEGTVYAMMNVGLEEGLVATTGMISESMWASENMTVVYDVMGPYAYFDDYLKVMENSTVGEYLTIGGLLNVTGNLYVEESVSIEGDIMAGERIQAMEGMFNTLSVDTATIETLTSMFLSTEEAMIDMATAHNSLVVTGNAQFETLEVKTMAEIDSSMADTWVSDDVVTDWLYTMNLTVTGSTFLNDAWVEESLVVGRPSVTENWHAAFETAFADVFKTMNLSADIGSITNSTADWVRYDWIDSEVGWFNSSMVDQAWFEMALIGDAVADRVWADWANITDVYPDNLWFENITASSNSTIEMLYSDMIWSETLTSDMGYAMWIEAGEIQTLSLNASFGTITNLDSNSGYFMMLNASEATITELMALNGYITMVSGDEVHYQWGNISNVWSTNFWTGIYNVTEYTTTNGIFGTRANMTSLWAENLRVTNSAWVGETDIMQDLTVSGRSYLDGGILSGEAVLSALTVAGEAEISTLVVSLNTFLNDLIVKRVTITESFESEMTNITENTTTEDLMVAGSVTLGGDLQVVGDTEMGGSLFVRGTTSFQVGSFTRIGTAQLNATSFESFTFRMADATIFDTLSTDLEVERTMSVYSAVMLGPMIDSTSGADYSFYSSMNPRMYEATQDGFTTNYTATTAFHSGASSIDQLVVTDPTDPTQAVLRVTAGGAMDFIDGEMIFGDAIVQGGLVFENQQNVAWARSSASPSTNLAPLGTDVWYDYSDLVDRDMTSPGMFFDTSRFSMPGLADDLLTLAPGHYTVSGNVYFRFSSAPTAQSMIVASAGVEAFSGTDSTGTQEWSVSCFANWVATAGSTAGSSCHFSNIINVPAGEMMTLRSRADWLATSAAIGTTMGVDARSTLTVTELFERVSQGV